MGCGVWEFILGLIGVHSEAIYPQTLVIDSLRLRIDSHRHEIFKQNGEIAYFSNGRPTKICDFYENTKHVDYGGCMGRNWFLTFCKTWLSFYFFKRIKMTAQENLMTTKSLHHRKKKTLAVVTQSLKASFTFVDYMKSILVQIYIYPRWPSLCKLWWRRIILKFL